MARQLESAHKAGQEAPSVKNKQSVSVVSAERISTEIRELKEFVLGVYEKIQELERKNETTTPRRRDDASCYSSHRQGHFARECPTKVSGNGSRGLRRANQSP